MLMLIYVYWTVWPEKGYSISGNYRASVSRTHVFNSIAMKSTSRRKSQFYTIQNKFRNSYSNPIKFINSRFQPGSTRNTETWAKFGDGGSIIFNIRTYFLPLAPIFCTIFRLTPFDERSCGPTLYQEKVCHTFIKNYYWEGLNLSLSTYIYVWNFSNSLEGEQLIITTISGNSDGAVGQENLAEIVPLQPCTTATLQSLQSFLDRTSALICFDRVTQEGRGTILIQQKGHLDWWNRLNPTIRVGYEKVAGMETEPRVRRVSITCESMVSLQQALRDLRESRMKSWLVKRSVKKKVEKVDTWELASAIMIVMTIRNKLRVCDKYVRWSRPDMRWNDAFKVDMPVCTKSGVAVFAEVTKAIESWGSVFPWE